MKANRIAWAACALVAGIVLVGSGLVAGCRERRTVPVQNGDTFVWQGGIVSVWDYSYDPGGYENHIEWVSRTGERQDLAYVGDHDAQLKLLPDGRLQARFYDENSRTTRPRKLQYLILTWRDRQSPPTKQVVIE
jgi:hypothetical protein